MKRKHIKIVHPIGQGAFISERHDDFNIVYDCGVDWPNRNSKYVNNLVKNSFPRRSQIDILFISHFDYDHISKIPILQDNNNIRKVILPFLHDKEKLLLTTLYRAIGATQDVINVIENPNDLFKESQIIQVMPYNDDDNTTDNTTINIDDLSTNKIDSGTVIRNSFWEFIPYNLEHKERSDQFKKLLLTNGFDPEDLRRNFTYTESNRKALNKLYKKVKGDINQNSMVVYSGPIKSKNEWIGIYDLRRNIQSSPTRRNAKIGISAIYTGDSNMNTYDLSQIFASKWKNVIYFQIPHHGDQKSFDLKQFKKRYMICPINFGEKNTYGHPANSILADLAMDTQYIKLITENPTSIFMVKIEYDA